MVFEWWLKTGLKKPVNGPKCQEFKWSAESHDFTNRLPDTHSVQYSDEISIQVLGIQTYDSDGYSITRKSDYAIRIPPYNLRRVLPLILHFYKPRLIRVK